MKPLGWAVVILAYQTAVVSGSAYFSTSGLMFVVSCGWFGFVLPLVLVAYFHWLQRQQTIKDLREMKRYLNDLE